MNSLAFAIAYWWLNVFYALTAVVASMLPGRAPLTAVIRFYSARQLWALRALGGIKVNLKGQQRLPAGAFIIGAKHHSWGDGFVMFANVPNLSFVTGDHLEKIPLLRGILHKLGAIVVDSCGGPEARKALSRQAAQAHAEGRRILIYPEGHLCAPGERFRYRTGIFHMYKDFDLPVVPVATNLSCFWRKQDFKKTPGTATVEFLDPIPTGLPRAEFMARLEAACEARTNELIALATGEPVHEAVLVEWDEKRKLNYVVEAA
ncbi:MAG: lysophospholipid acyltransferase family protein [Alphaproteobacteria bacterium]